MWPYYGSKSKVVDLYPSPKYGKIIESFAGSARYSLKYFDREILLVDKYPVIVDIWRYLQQASEKDILGLPRLKEGERLSDHKFVCLEARLLMGYLIAKGGATPRDKASHMATTHRPNNINYSLKRIAGSLYKIRHWEIRLGSYEDIPNEPATWFIDPPYMVGGEVYKENKIDYPALAEWSRGRMGQVIVCENAAADWLPFIPLKKTKGVSNKSYTEGIWTNIEEDFPLQQIQLFENV